MGLGWAKPVTPQWGPRWQVFREGGSEEGTGAAAKGGRKSGAARGSHEIRPGFLFSFR